MKRLLNCGLLGILCLARTMWAQPVALYQNDGIIQSPPLITPQIDASNFVNNGTFDINQTAFSGAGQISTLVNVITIFDTSDTLNVTNRGIIKGNTGFRFDYVNNQPGGNGARKMANNFVNTGSITLSATNNDPSLISFLFNTLGNSKVFVSATNVINSGVIEAGQDGLISISGKSVNLTRGTARIDGRNDLTGGFASVPFFNGFFGLAIGFTGSSSSVGIFDQFWGVGQNPSVITNGFFGTLLPEILDLPTPTSAPEQVTGVVPQSFFGFQSQTYGTNVTIPLNANAVAKVFDTPFPGGLTRQVVFVGNANAQVTPEVRFEQFFGAAVPYIRWKNVSPNIDGTSTTSELYLGDFLGLDIFTQLLDFNGSYGIPPLAIQPTFKPDNYQLTRTEPVVAGFFDTLTVPVIPWSPVLLAGMPANNIFTIYGARLLPTTAQIIPEIIGSVYFNMAGRFEITADQVLNLNRVHIDGANYMSLKATNHYTGSVNAQIAVPYNDINLASTNGSLQITNLLAPSIRELVGPVEVWSILATNINPVSGFITRYHVMIVSSSLSTNNPCTILNLKLNSRTLPGDVPGSLIISDILNVSSNLFLYADRLTITSNAPGSITPVGQLNLTSGDVLWSSSLPVLKNLTNFGTISTISSAFFAGARQAPFFSTTFNEPYLSIVNHGNISASGSLFWANYFESTGTKDPIDPTLNNFAAISNAPGALTIQAGTGLLFNSSLTARGDMNLSVGSMLVASNLNITTGGKLTLQATNNLTDTGSNSLNFWVVSNAVDLLVKPATGDLLGTTITSYCPKGGQVVSTWAGVDRGANPSGFKDNLAIGHLILDGDFDCLFSFTGANGSNAIYVDLLELRNSAANRINPDFPNLDVDPSITIYYADAKIGGTNNIDIAEKLNHANGDRFRWVPSYAGAFSGIPFTYPNGNVYYLNRALVSSSSIDSNGNNIPNSADTAPVFVTDNLVVSVRVTNVPPVTAFITWPTLANGTNHLEFKTNLSSANWTPVTNFVSTVNGIANVAHRATNNPCFYRVRIDPQQP